MKQHITGDDYFGLSQEARNKLDAWYVKTYFEEGRMYTDVSPYLTIGQMIEFLEEREVNWGNLYFEGDEDLEVSKKDRFLMDEYKITLCDALWEAVKTILEEE